MKKGNEIRKNIGPNDFFASQTVFPVLTQVLAIMSISQFHSKLRCKNSWLSPYVDLTQKYIQILVI